MTRTERPGTTPSFINCGMSFSMRALSSAFFTPVFKEAFEDTVFPALVCAMPGDALNKRASINPVSETALETFLICHLL
jgi:hypothetical protein